MRDYELARVCRRQLEIEIQTRVSSLYGGAEVGDLKIAEVGNSGGADESHLHIHAQRSGAAHAPMSGDPLPVRFDRRFLVRGDRIVTDQTEKWNTR